MQTTAPVLAAQMELLPTADQVAAVNDNLDYTVMENFEGEERQLSPDGKEYLSNHRKLYLE